MTDQHRTPRREDLPDGSVRIAFATPILFHTEPKGALTLRPPTAMEVIEIGDPSSWVSNGAAATLVIDRDRLVAWFRKLLIDHDADIVGRESDVALGLLIEESILDFFQNARTRLKPASAP